MRLEYRLGIVKRNPSYISKFSSSDESFLKMFFIAARAASLSLSFFGAFLISSSENFFGLPEHLKSPPKVVGQYFKDVS